MTQPVSNERLIDVLYEARLGFYAGSIDDREALDEASQRGFVVRDYSGPAGILGLAKLKLTRAGKDFIHAE